MITKTVAIYVFFDDISKSMDYKEPINRKTTEADIATAILGKRRFNRRMHKAEELLAELFFHLVSGDAIKELNTSQTHCIDTFPIAVCQNIRIPCYRTVQGEKYRGYCASKRTYFYGFKVHVIITSEPEFGISQH